MTPTNALCPVCQQLALGVVIDGVAYCARCGLDALKAWQAKAPTRVT